MVSVNSTSLLKLFSFVAVCQFIPVFVCVRCTVQWLYVSSFLFLCVLGAPYGGRMSAHSCFCVCWVHHTVAICQFIPVFVCVRCTVQWPYVSSFLFLCVLGAPYGGCMSAHSCFCVCWVHHTVAICQFIPVFVCVRCTVRCT